MAATWHDRRRDEGPRRPPMMRPAPTADRDLDEPAGDEHQHEVRTDGGRRRPPRRRRRRTTRMRRRVAVPMRAQLAGTRPRAALRATAGTAAPAPAAAPRTQAGGWPARNTAERARMRIRPGTMKQIPPEDAPRPSRAAARRRRSRAASMPGRAGGWSRRSRPRTPSASIQPPLVDAQSGGAGRCGRGVRRTRCSPSRVHSRAMVTSGTRSTGRGVPGPVTATGRRGPHGPAPAAAPWSSGARAVPGR